MSLTPSEDSYSPVSTPDTSTPESAHTIQQSAYEENERKTENELLRSYLMKKEAEFEQGNQFPYKSNQPGMLIDLLHTYVCKYILK